jgi:hypothetical protein
MGFIASLVISLVIMVVGELLRPKQNPPNAKASSIDDFQIPTAEEDRHIPVFVGKCLITGANVTTYGDLRKVPIKKKVKTGLFSSKMQTIGHKYYLGMQMMLAHGRPDIYCHEIRFGDKMPLAHNRVDEGNGVTAFFFFDPQFFGGDESEGGVSGTLRFYAGTDTQPANSYFGTKLINIAPLPTPPYPNMCGAVLEGMYLGTTPYLKPVAYVLSSYPNQLGLTSNRHKIADDANPICFIYEILTDTTWGLAVSPGLIDIPSFVSAGNTVAAEGYGISMILNGAATAQDIINDILRHIDGVTYTDPTTGLITMKLARQDYVVDDLPIYDPSYFIQGIQFSRASWSQTRNTIRATWVNRAENYTTVPHSAQDLSNIQQRGGEIAMEDIDFTGFSTFAAVDLATARALKTLSYPLAKIDGVLDRRAYALRPGSVFKLRWPERGIEALVMRVTKVEYGSTSVNTISITAVEDIFSITESAYSQPPPSGWVDPLGPVLPLARQYAFELPYAMLGLEAPYIATLGSRTTGLDEGYNIHSDRLFPFDTWDFRNSNITFTPSGILNVAYSAGTPARDPVGFTVNQLIDYEEIAPTVTEDDLLAGASLVLIESGSGVEIVAPKNFAFASGVLTITDVIRGVYDTSPTTHPIGARVWFVSYGYGIENDEPYSGIPRQISVKLPSFNLRSTLAITSATPILVDLTGRASMPYPLEDVKVNGLISPVTTVGDAVLTWKYRNKYLQAGRVVPDDAAADPLTGGDTFRVDVYINNVFVRTITGLTSATYTYPAATRATDNADGSLLTRLDVYYYSAAGVAGPKVTRSFTMTGFGMTFGQNFGGTQA